MLTKQTSNLYNAYRAYADIIVKVTGMDTVTIRLSSAKLVDLIPDYYNPKIAPPKWLQYRVSSRLRMYAIGLYDDYL